MSEMTRRRRRRRTAVFFLGIIFIFLNICSGKQEEETNYNYVAPSRWSPARKARFFNNKVFSYREEEESRTKYHHVLVGTTTLTTTSSDHQAKRNINSDSNVYEDAKRLVHTGPNPLHN